MRTPCRPKDRNGYKLTTKQDPMKNQTSNSDETATRVSPSQIATNKATEQKMSLQCSSPAEENAAKARANAMSILISLVDSPEKSEALHEARSDILLALKHLSQVKAGRSELRPTCCDFCHEEVGETAAIILDSNGVHKIAKQRKRFTLVGPEEIPVCSWCIDTVMDSQEVNSSFCCALCVCMMSYEALGAHNYEGIFICKDCLPDLIEAKEQLDLEKVERD